jgi:hypothetical protein
LVLRGGDSQQFGGHQHEHDVSHKKALA